MLLIPPRVSASELVERVARRLVEAELVRRHERAERQRIGFDKGDRLEIALRRVFRRKVHASNRRVEPERLRPARKTFMIEDCAVVTPMKYIVRRSAAA